MLHAMITIHTVHSIHSIYTIHTVHSIQSIPPIHIIHVVHGHCLINYLGVHGMSCIDVHLLIILMVLLHVRVTGILQVPRLLIMHIVH